MLFIYKPAINSILRNTLKPIVKLLPEKYQFPINGNFTIQLGQNKKIHWITNPTSYISRILFWNGLTGFEYSAVRIFMQLATQSKCFFDIGANMGYYSMVATAMNSSIKVVGFEPLPAANKYFHLIAQANNFKNITIEQTALSNFTGTAQFSAIKNPKFIDIQDQLAGDGGLSEKFSGARSVFKFDVAVDTLDNYVLHKLPSNLKIDLIKLDTEASEHLVLAGAESVLQNHRPIIQCEVLPGQIEKELQIIFDRNNDSFFQTQDKGLKKVQSLEHTNSDNKDYFLVPKELEFKVSSFIV